MSVVVACWGPAPCASPRPAGLACGDFAVNTTKFTGENGQIDSGQVKKLHCVRVDGKIKPDVLMNLGRVDYLERHAVATLVYRYREHVIDVFVRPSPESATRSPRPPVSTVRGFNVVRASGAGE